MAISVYSVVLSLIIAVVLQRIIAALYRWIQSCVAARKFPGYPGTTFFLGDLHVSLIGLVVFMDGLQLFGHDEQ